MPPITTPTHPAADTNRVLLAGTLAEPAELHHLDATTPVCFLKLRCTWNQAPQLLGDEGQQDVNVLLLGEKARKMAPYLYGGRRLVIDGSLASASWEQMGVEELETVCVVGERVEFFDSAPDGAEDWPGSDLKLFSLANEASDDPDSPPMMGFSEDIWF